MFVASSLITQTAAAPLPSLSLASSTCYVFVPGEVLEMAYIKENIEGRGNALTMQLNKLKQQKLSLIALSSLMFLQGNKLPVK